jgi:hypothetical protein
LKIKSPLRFDQRRQDNGDQKDNHATRAQGNLRKDPLMQAVLGARHEEVPAGRRTRLNYAGSDLLHDEKPVGISQAFSQKI